CARRIGPYYAMDYW
nr:immunoglobulin heavy chain junction region [Mus musculus]MBK4185810.1 immunoglobulin heavy chain junction region [Mus musculus]